jgi:hypothetical protein
MFLPYRYSLQVKKYDKIYQFSALFLLLNEMHMPINIWRKNIHTNRDHLWRYMCAWRLSWYNGTGSILEMDEIPWQHQLPCPWLCRCHDENVPLGCSNMSIAPMERPSVHQGHLLNELLWHRLAHATELLLGILARSSSPPPREGALRSSRTST